jgi:hypothetical protein
MPPNRKAPPPGESGPSLSPEPARPIDLGLAKAVEQLPGRNGLPGGSRFELKLLRGL